jgi:DNA gyrase subunit A
MIAIREVNDNDELVIITGHGMVIRQSVRDLRVMGRNTQGVRLIRLNDEDYIADIARVISEDEEPKDGEALVENNGGEEELTIL